MNMGQSPAQEARNRYGALKQHHPDDLARLDGARRDLAAAKLEDFIKRTVDAAPPLTAAQRDKLALLLQGGADDAAN